MSTDKVLLVDDEVDFIETLAERLRARGLHVDTAHDGAAGLEKAQQTRFDAIVLDFAMPGMNGVETLRELRERDPDLQVMLLSGQSTIKTAVEAMRLGAVEVFEKPTDIDTLLEKIREARARALELAAKRSSEAIDDILRKRGW